MRTRMHLSRLLVSFLASLLLVGAAVAGPASAGGGSGPSFEETGCDTPLFAGHIPDGMQAECGLLTVKEDRHSRPGQGNEVVLPVVIIQATGPDPQPDPLLMLSGGPSDAGIDTFLGGAFATYPIAELAVARDVILLDQRGTGNAQPRLDCPQVTAAHHATLETGLVAETERLTHELATIHDAYAACAEGLRAQGVDLDQYNTYASAMDLTDLRKALGIKQWNVYGHSYGGALALELMRQDRGAIRSAVLDAPLPPYAQDTVGAAQSVLNNRTALLANEAEFDHASTFGQTLLQMSQAAKDRYDQTPLVFDMDGHTYQFTGADAVFTLDKVMALTSMLPDVGGLAFLLAYGDDATVAGTLQVLFGMLNPYYADRAWGMWITAMCAERSRVLEPADLATLIRDFELHTGVLGRVALPQFPEVCDGLGIQPTPLPTTMVHPTRVPTLVTNGQLDFGSLAEVSADLADRLGPRAQYVEFPRVGHITLGSSACANQIAIDFINTPTHDLDTSCTTP